VGVEELDGRHVHLHIRGTGGFLLFQVEQELSDFFFSQFLGVLHEVPDESLDAGHVIPAGRGPVLPQCQVLCHSVTILSHGRSPFSGADARPFVHLDIRDRPWEFFCEMARISVQDPCHLLLPETGYSQRGVRGVVAGGTADRP